MSLLPQHQRLLEGSAISAEVVAARGYRSVETKAELGRLGFARSQQNVPALLIPLHDVHGECAGYLIRPDEPRQTGGRIRKYEMPARSQMVLDVPPAAREHLGDPARPLFITEGSRKADAAMSHGLVCISLTGIWAWRGTNERGGKVALAAFESIALERREVYVVFDSDVMVKPSVHAALERLADFLRHRKAKVRFVYLPAGEGGSKVGLDDYLAAGHGVDDLLASASTELRAMAPDRPAGPYEETPGGIVWNKPAGHGDSIAVPLTNFTARIVSDIAYDDGVEVEQRLEIEGELRGRRYRFAVPAAKFAPMGWVIDAFGAGAIIEPGQGTKDRARHAIQTFSGDIARSIAYGHLGWRRIGDEYYYLHAGGAIGAEEVLEGVEVVVSEPLQPFELPAPPAGDRLRDAIRASLGLLEVAREEVAYALLAAVGRAPLGHCDAVIFLFGETGTFKSELAALCQQSWGARLDARHLPASFTATANYIEGLLFTAKDVLAVVDDFAPEGSSFDIQKAHRDVGRIIRAQGNLQARGRMRADGGLRPVKPPRGLLLATGEDVPRGHSVRARMVVIGIEHGDVDVAKLTELQRLAAEGMFAASMAGYVRYLARRYDEVEGIVPEAIAELRESREEQMLHRRTPEAVAQLQIGLQLYLEYAHDAGAISAEEAGRIEEEGRAVLRRVGQLQGSYLTSSEPATRFLELLGSAISSGSAYVASPAGAEPEQPGVWGWRHVEVGDSATWRPQGTRIGWTEGDDLWLDPDAAYGAAQDLARRVGDPFTVGTTTLNKRLAERGLLASTDLGTPRRCVPVRRVIGGARRQVLHLKASRLVVVEEEIDQLFQDADGRDGRTPEIGSRLEDERGGAQPDRPNSSGTDRRGDDSDHSDHAPLATEDEEAEIRRVSNKFGVARETDS